jgi:hypothetical protein
LAQQWQVCIEVSKSLIAQEAGCNVRGEHERTAIWLATQDKVTTILRQKNRNRCSNRIIAFAYQESSDSNGGCHKKSATIE